MQVAMQPLLGRLEGVTNSAALAEAALRRVVSWASWRLLGWIMALIAALVVLGWLTGNALVWWDTGTVTQLQSEISELQANNESWVKAGMLDRLERCTPGNRPCVEVNEDAGPFGTPEGHRITGCSRDTRGGIKGIGNCFGHGAWPVGCRSGRQRDLSNGITVTDEEVASIDYPSECRDHTISPNQQPPDAVISRQLLNRRRPTDFCVAVAGWKERAKPGGLVP